MRGRRYFAIAHYCIPVRLDGFDRNLPFEELAFPFPSLIEWRHVVIDVPRAGVPRLLERLASLPPRELAQRTRYLQAIAPWLLFDREGGRVDAADAALWELERRVLTEAPRPRHLLPEVRFG